MLNDTFIAFWTGMAGGTVCGIVLCAVAIAVQNSIEGGKRNDDELH